MEKNITFEITQFDFDLINHIRVLRETAGFSKEELSLKMGLAKSFIGNVESYTQRHKYSTRHIALLSKAFAFKNISDLMMFPTPQYDKIKVTLKQTYNERGSKVIDSEILKIEEI